MSALCGRFADGAAALTLFAGREALLAAVIFIAVWALTRMLGRAPARLHAALWSLVLARLALPPGLAAPWSARAMVERLLAALSGAAGGGSATAAIPTTPAEGFDALPGVLLGATPSAGVGWPALFAAAWLAGAAAVAVRFFTRRRVYRRAAATARPATSPALVAPAEGWRRLLGVGRPVELRVADEDLPPFTLGLLRPVIVLPRALVAAAGEGTGPLLESVVAHEMVHVRRLDALRLGFQNVVQAVWFWHPAAWWAAARLNDARERIVDETVLARGRIAHRDYAASLLAVLRLDLEAPGGPAAAPALVHRKRRIAMRIQEILRGRATGRCPALAPALVAGFWALVLLPMGGVPSAGGAVPTDPPAAVADVAPLAPGPAAPAPPAVALLPSAGPSAPVAAAPVAPASLAPPVAEVLATPLAEARLTSGFGGRRDPRDGRRSNHDGVDLAAPRGTAVLAPAPGRVEVADLEFGSEGRLGRTVVLDHGDGLETLYAHLDSILVERGEEVATGQTIGRVGSSGWVTGAHLHFEVRRDGRPIDPASVVLGLPAPAPSR